MNREQYMTAVAVYSCIFAAIAMGAMLYFMSVKTIVIAEEWVTREPADIQKNTEYNVENQKLYFSKDNVQGEFLNIPLPQGMRPDDITIENRIMDQEIHLYMKGVPGNFYQSNEITGNYKKIVEGYYSSEGNVTEICFRMSGIYEQVYRFENDLLRLSFEIPGKIYDKIVILDAESDFFNQMDENSLPLARQITVELANKVSEILKKSDIKVYCTRSDNSFSSFDKRIALVNLSGADIAVSISVNYNKDQSDISGIETKYNGQYFIPWLGSIELADFLEKETTAATLARTLGLCEEENENSVVMQAEIPAAQIMTGYLSNQQEALWLTQEEYQNRIAQGIAQGIIKAFEFREASLPATDLNSAKKDMGNLNE